MNERVHSSPWGEFLGPNAAYVLELYERYLADPDSVDADTKRRFERYGPPGQELQDGSIEESRHGVAPSGEADTADPRESRAFRVLRLVRNLRQYGHMGAAVNPIQRDVEEPEILKLSRYGLTEEELGHIPAAWVWDEPVPGVRTAMDFVRHLQRVYMGTITFEFAHVHDEEERAWLTRMVELNTCPPSATGEQSRDLLHLLTQVEEFERFLHKTFTGQKRFSIEGVDMLVPMLNEIVRQSVLAGVKHVMMGMAHRGRLNTLAHVLGKPYADIFSEFHASPNKELVPSEGSMGINYGWTGDVKYHLGASRDVQQGDVLEARIILANNPSHLEFVDPVVEGYTRAAQESRSTSGSPKQNVDASISVLVHGDAAFPGEGIVAETLNLSSLEGYQTGGTIHLIPNNQLGFTAEAGEGRSTRYASDLAKGFEIPIVHVNADDAGAALSAVALAFAYRQRYHKDFLIDLIGYRRWGHNEADDPVMTQPVMYREIASHPSVRRLYASQLVEAGVLTEEEVNRIEAEVRGRLQQAYDEVKSRGPSVQSAMRDNESPELADTGVALETLKVITENLLEVPPGFTPYAKLRRILERRRLAFEPTGKIDWAHAEALAFASILSDGIPIRLTGQDSERGTFGHRHLVLHDENTGQRYCPLQHLRDAKASFAVHNSPLSENAILGFEYGYSVQAPEAFVLWEAQFGDFANAGQVIIDQFLASGQAKWAQMCGLVLLLPHGYEGQGPEHSSGRLERYLQLSAERNWRVANVTTTAQYFHLLRSQASLLRKSPRPLVIMTPKSLLRNPRAASVPREFETGRFTPIYVDPLDCVDEDVTRLILCSGKVAIDLRAAVEKREATPHANIACARLEQIYPFPHEELDEVLGRYPNLTEVVWLQEEPKNMGAWDFVSRRIRSHLSDGVNLFYIGRKARSSPAEGFAGLHDSMQNALIEDALRLVEQEEHVWAR